MRDFLREYYTEITIFLEFIAAFTAIVLFKKYSKSKVKYFIYFIIYVFFLEIIGGYPGYIEDYGWFYELCLLVEGTIFEKNYWWYFFGWNLIAHLILIYFYYKIVQNKLYKSLIKINAIIFVMIFTANLAINIDLVPIVKSPITDVWNTISVTFCIILYLLELLQSDKILEIKTSFYFYASTALFIFSLILTPLVFYNDYFNNADWNYVFLQMDIYLLMNTFLYLTFAFALIWCKPKQDL